MKIATIIGARPQFIKAATISHLLQNDDEIEETIIHTGQHFDDAMSKVFFSELGIKKPQYNLGIKGKSHGQMTGLQLYEIEKILLDKTPNWVLVYGDTNSTVSGALAAAKLNIPVIHIESGLRSFNRNMPEEINRIITDHISKLLFSPTEVALKNLISEGLCSSTGYSKCYMVGDVMYDAAKIFGKKADATSNIIKRINITPNNYILATIHRAENTDQTDRLINIFNAFEKISNEIPVIWPIHPRTRNKLKEKNLIPKKTNIIEPVGYLDMMMLEKNSSVIATDSGGIQKEAYFHSIPCVTIRKETEWVELVDSNWNILADPNSSDDLVKKILSRVNKKGKKINIFGDGNSAKKIIHTIKEMSR